MAARRNYNNRTGGVYIAVLSTALIVALLGISALVGQRLQNRMIVASGDMRQAQLNANSAVEFALLTMKQDTGWRANYSNGYWFIKRATGTGTCTLNVTDPADGNLANNADDSVVVLGIGYSGDAEQRVKVTVDPRKDPLSCLRSAVAVGGTVSLQNDVLRANSGLITANQISGSSSQVYGNVEAVTISGSTYNGTKTTVLSEKRPTMPDWTSVFSYYKTNGTQIDINSLATQTPNLGRNVGMESGTTDWTGTPTGIPIAEIEQRTSPVHGGSNSLRVKNRQSWYAGAAQAIDGYVKPNQQYTIDCWVNLQSGSLEPFYISLYTKGSGSAQYVTGPDTYAVAGVWKQVSATLTAPSWSGNLEYAFIKIAGAGSSNDRDFILDDVTIRETTTGRFIYRQVLGPGVNPFGATTNAEGVYWINCNGAKLIIERSRILGTLLVLNPGSGSCVANGPIQWSPAVAGYPALLVDADTASSANFALNFTNRALSEKENGVNYNPTGASHDEFGADGDTNDIYRSNIRGLVAVRNNLTYSNRSLTRGQIIVGGGITNTGGELEVEYQPDSLLNPPPGFLAPYSYIRRPASAQKAVLP